MLGIGEEEGPFCWPFIFSFNKVSEKALRKCSDTRTERMTSYKMVLYVFKRDGLLFLTYPKKSIPPLLNISISFLPCQVTHLMGSQP